MSTRQISLLRLGLVFLCSFFLCSLALLSPAVSAGNQSMSASGHSGDAYTTREMIAAGHAFFGEMSGGLATVIEKAGAHNKVPNGYILGEEGSGAFIGGLRYGEGILYTRNAGEYRVFWQGPSVGVDFGGDGSRVMMLVYDLPSIDKMYRRFIGINGSAYAVGGLSVQAMGFEDTLIMPVRTGVGARLGINMGYLKFTEKPTWNPF